MDINYIKEEGFLQIVVSDDGPGFSFEMMSYVIDFMSVPVSHEIRQHIPKSEGIGMGLHICKSILSQLGGKIIINTGKN